MLSMSNNVQNTCYYRETVGNRRRLTKCSDLTKAAQRHHQLKLLNQHVTDAAEHKSQFTQWAIDFGLHHIVTALVDVTQLTPARGLYQRITSRTVMHRPPARTSCAQVGTKALGCDSQWWINYDKSNTCSGCVFRFTHWLRLHREQTQTSAVQTNISPQQLHINQSLF